MFLCGLYFMPAWLQNLCARSLKLQSTEDNLIDRVTDDIAAMMAEHGDTAVIYDGSADIEQATTARARAAHLPALLCRAESKTGTLCTQECVGDDAPHIFVSRNIVQKTLQARQTIIPDMANVTTILHDAGALLHEANVDGLRGWVLDAKWWKSQTAQTQSFMLRAV
jgi:hypothetical protein